MKIVSILRARNESDVLEAVIRHTLAYSVAVVVALHRCLDNSRMIVEALKSEGLPITCSEHSGLLHDQACSMSAMAAEAAAQGADWIVPLDADEFVVGDVPSRLSEADPLVPLAVPWQTYVPLPNDDPAESNVLKRICHRRKVELPQWTKVIVPGIALRERGYTLSFGNHSLADKQGQPVSSGRVQLTMAHFPVRSLPQICSKVFGGWPSSAAYPDRRAGSTFQWRAIYDSLKVSDPASLDITRIALQYATSSQWDSLPSEVRAAAGNRRPPDIPPDLAIVFDPVPCRFLLQYEAIPVAPMTVLLDTAEAFAMAYGDCHSA